MNCKDFLDGITTFLTGERPAIRIVEDDSGAIIHITPAGRVSSLIGANGATINAIRVLAKALGYNGKHRIKILLDE
ncbi:MAG TPA: hypothetical protein VFL85_01605 [Candidatus Saccharimonadales bacterium]|nr:hypothetical protein [Candidatus Saccharimonadales bacterium]